VLKRHLHRQNLYKFLLISSGLAIAVLLCQFSLYRWEFMTYDLLFRMKAPQKTSNNIVLLKIDSQTLDDLGRSPNAFEHTKLLEILQRKKPKAIAYLLDPNKIEGSKKDRLQLAKTIHQSRNFMVGIPELDVGANTEKFLLPYPYDKVATFQAILSEDRVNFGGDGVSRRAILTYKDRWFMHPVAAQLLSGKKTVQDYQGQFTFKGSTQIFTNTRKSGSFPSASFIDTLKSQELMLDAKGKVILVGQASDFDAQDFVRTPYSREINAMPKIEYHANIIDSLIQNNGIVKAGNIYMYATTIAMSLLTLFFTFQLRPVMGIASILGSGILYFFICYIAFSSTQIWLPIAHPLLALFCTYYFFIPYRLISESKKSWQYQQKNELLLQVEELKNNFISMMSHDLKTPLARIQGMAEMASVKKQNLDPQQCEALESIKMSTIELNTFVSSVLNLSRVESQGVQLNKESKDINKIIEDIISKNQYQADKKNIQIVFEPEPLFAISIDSDLMKQTIHNLVENAIKYSLENSKILITTEEADGKIQIQVADQGIGIPSEEMDKIFTKFYRSKNAKSSPIKGNGLGLYLSYYFVNLHEGNITVESEPNKGSTFTVQIPV